MTIEERRLRERAAQRRLIVESARSVAEREGWEAVTTRRLSSEIEYSQPVIYKHFASLDGLAEAVALEGFSELAEALGRARSTTSPDEALSSIAHAYSTFAVENPALYDAMFTRPSQLPFSTADAPAPLSAAYAELRAAVSTSAGGRDVDTLAEVFWAALHGLVTLDRNRRLRPDLRAERIDLLVAQFSSRSAGDAT